MAAEPVELISEGEIAARVADMAKAIAPTLDAETVCVVLLTGAMWFAADLTRALSRLGQHPLFDALWLASYGDERRTSGQVMVRTGLQRSVEGRKVLVIDDVLDSGLSLVAARQLLLDSGAAEVRIAVFAAKPWPEPRAVTPDFVAWRAPARFLVGYGMDHAGRYRDLPYIGALD